MKSIISILVVDDEPDLLDNIKLTLETEDYQIFTASDGLAALKILETESIHLILADVAMPKLNGYQLYEAIRKNMAWVTIPFIFLTARSLDTDICYGKSLGADDYLTKPIRSRELIAVVKGKLRRTKHLIQSLEHLAPLITKEKRFLSFGTLKMDTQGHRVWLDDDIIKISAREFALLKQLALQPGKVASPKELIKFTHDIQTDQTEAGTLLRPLILSLRRKLGARVGDMGMIENVRGIGYRLISVAN